MFASPKQRWHWLQGLSAGQGSSEGSGRPPRLGRVHVHIGCERAVADPPTIVDQEVELRQTRGTSSGPMTPVTAIRADPPTDGPVSWSTSMAESSATAVGRRSRTALS